MTKRKGSGTIRKQSETPIPDNIKAAIDALEAAGFTNTTAPVAVARARLDALIGEVVAERDRLRGQLATAQDLFDGLYTENVNLRSTIAAQEQPR